MGFLLSAALDIPANETTEMIIADKRDIIFLIFSPFLNIKLTNYVPKQMYSQPEDIYIYYRYKKMDICWKIVTQ